MNVALRNGTEDYGAASVLPLVGELGILWSGVSECEEDMEGVSEGACGDTPAERESKKVGGGCASQTAIKSME